MHKVCFFVFTRNLAVAFCQNVQKYVSKVVEPSMASHLLKKTKYKHNLFFSFVFVIVLLDLYSYWAQCCLRSRKARQSSMGSNSPDWFTSKPQFEGYFWSERWTLMNLKDTSDELWKICFLAFPFGCFLRNSGRSAFWHSKLVTEFQPKLVEEENPNPAKQWCSAAFSQLVNHFQSLLDYSKLWLYVQYLFGASTKCLDDALLFSSKTVRWFLESFELFQYSICGYSIYHIYLMLWVLVRCIRSLMYISHLEIPSLLTRLQLLTIQLSNVGKPSEPTDPDHKWPHVDVPHAHVPILALDAGSQFQYTSSPWPLSASFMNHLN